MASLQKITITRYVLGTGKTVRYVSKGTPGAKKVKEKSAKWYAIFKEGRKKVKVPLSPDKDSAQTMLADLLRNRERAKAGLLDPYKSCKELPARQHVDDYLADLRVQGVTDKHAANAKNGLYRVLNLCGFTTLADLQREPLDKWLAGLTRSTRTKNWYREHAVAFGNWLVKKDRLPDNPFRNVTRASGGEVKRKRRALTLPELRHLIETACERPLLDGMTIRRGPRKGQRAAKLSEGRRAKLDRIGLEKYMLYKTAVLTGLRRGELRKLEVGHLNLEGPTPHLHLPGVLPDGSRGTKNGNDAILPLQMEHARELRGWVAGRASTAKVFAIPDPSRSIAGLKRDLNAARIPYQDAKGRYFDFHSFRVCTSSFLHQAGVHPRIIQLFMRHSDPHLTAHYDDATLHDLRKAADALPRLTLRTDVERQLDAKKVEWLQHQHLVNRLVEDIEQEVQQRLWPELEARLGPEKIEEVKKWLVDRLFQKWKMEQPGDAASGTASPTPATGGEAGINVS